MKTTNDQKVLNYFNSIYTNDLAKDYKLIVKHIEFDKSSFNLDRTLRVKNLLTMSFTNIINNKDLFFNDTTRFLIAYKYLYSHIIYELRIANHYLKQNKDSLAYTNLISVASSYIWLAYLPCRITPSISTRDKKLDSPNLEFYKVAVDVYMSILKLNVSKKAKDYVKKCLFNPLIVALEGTIR